MSKATQPISPALGHQHPGELLKPSVARQAISAEQNSTSPALVQVQAGLWGMGPHRLQVPGSREALVGM